MSKINIGKYGPETLWLDLDILRETRMLVTADSGGGKTFALKRICEQAFGKIQIIVIDPEGEFSPLREKFDFVFCGPGGETPAHIGSAAMLGEKLLQLHASCICDLSEMKPSERHIWVKNFLDGLIEAPKALRHPVLVIVDEAHLFCPEHGKGESVASESMIALCTRGRKRGLVALFATQRLATLSKDASGMLLNRMIGPTFEDVNRKRAAQILGIPEGKATMAPFYDHIKLLSPGFFFTLGRAISKEVKVVHIGPIETPHGDKARKYATAPPPAPAAIAKMLPQLSDIPKEAEQQAKSVKDLKLEISDLKRQLHTQPKAVPAPPVKVVDNSEVIRLRGLIVDGAKVLMKVTTIDFTKQEITEVLTRMQRAIKTPSKSALSGMIAQAEQTLKQSLPKLVRPVPTGNEVELPKGEMAILTAAAQYPEGVDKNQATILTGYKRSTRDAYALRLGGRGYMTDKSGKYFITEEGVAALGANYKPLPTGAELRRYWLDKLPGGEKKVLECLLTFEQGATVDKEVITQVTGYKPSTRNAYLLRMSAKKIVETDTGTAKVAAILFD